MVRFALVFAAVSLCAPAAYAGACGVSIQLWSATPELARDGLVVLDAPVSGGDFIRVASAMKFVTPAETIAAHVVEVIGDRKDNHVQIVLAPKRLLPARATVHVETGDRVLDKLLANATLSTGDRSDGRAVQWMQNPKVLGRRQEPSNKGDTIDVYRVRTKLDAPAFIVATFSNAGDTQVVLYRGDDEVGIGITGCGSMWHPRDGVSTVALSALGPDGNEVNAQGAPLRLRY